MTRPKRWYLEKDEEKNVMIKNVNGQLIKKPNAARPLGKIIQVDIATCDLFHMIIASYSIYLYNQYPIIFKTFPYSV